MSDGQVRLVRPAGALPPGLIPNMPPGMAPGQQLAPGPGLMQLPPGLVPLRAMTPVCPID